MRVKGLAHKREALACIDLFFDGRQDELFDNPLSQFLGIVCQTCPGLQIAGLMITIKHDLEPGVHDINSRTLFIHSSGIRHDPDLIKGLCWNIGRPKLLPGLSIDSGPKLPAKVCFRIHE